MFPFARFPGVDTVLGPEMKSTGEVMGIDTTFETAFAKSQIGGGTRLPKTGTVFVSVRDVDKARIVDTLRLLTALGFKIIATSGHPALPRSNRACRPPRSTRYWKAAPISWTPSKTARFSWFSIPPRGRRLWPIHRSLRAAALLHKVPYYTTLSGAVAAAQGIKAFLGGDLEVRALQSYFSSRT